MSCSVDGCTRPAKARGWCGTHYARWARLGTVELTPYVTPPCSVEGCGRLTYSNGRCVTHDQRMRRLGRVELEPQPTVAERIAAGVVVDATGCWIWQGTPAKTGYGRMSVGDRLQYVHRLSYEQHVGPVPDGLTIDHLCRVRLCCNPEHLEPATREENTRRENAVRWAGAEAVLT
jgi:hypothetical protein